MFQSPENAMLVFRAVVVFAASTSSVLAEAPKTRIAASKATTFVTRPLRKDGSVDYAAAFNRRYGKGVTPENNAVVPLWRAFGPREIPPESRAEFFRRLGVKPPPETGPYFVPLFELTKLLQGRKKEDARDALREDFNAALDEPWTAAQYPAIAEWLTVNAGPLELLVEAAERPRFFVPLVVSKQRPMLIDGMLVENAVRLHASNAVRVLVVRAHLHLANGRIEKAARDLLACHRWARHIDRQRRLSSSFTAHALDGVAHSADRALARSKRFPSAQATAYRKQLAQLGPWNGLAETFRFSERCFQLDLLRLMAGENALDRFVELLPDDAEKDLKAQFRRKGVSRVQAAIDWNAVAKDVNRHFDRMAAIAATSDLSERRKAYRKYAADLGPEEAVGRRLVRLIRLEKPDRDDLARLLSATLVRSDVGMLGSAMSSQDRARVQFDLAQVMLALAAHRKDHGAYPERLSTLTPKYLPELPPDRFTGKPLTYARDGRGYLLYSRGANGRDDGGEFRRPSADDIAIHVQRSSR